MFSEIRLYIEKISPRLKKKQHRLAIAFHPQKSLLLEGSDNSRNNEKQFEDELLRFVCSLSEKNTLIISSLVQGAVQPGKARISLGEEYEFVVFDVREGFHADTCGIVSGMLCGGGILLIILPEYKRWLQQTNIYLDYFKSLLLDQAGIIYFNHNETENIIPESIQEYPVDEHSIENKSDLESIFPYKTIDQMDAVEGLFSSLQSQDECCAVIASGRGRGKSASIGLLAAKLMNENDVNLLVTAPRLSVADPLFYHLQQQCPDGELKRSSFNFRKSSIRFIAPDALLESLPGADLVFVDEAAAIPVPMLKKLVEHYAKIIFLTTTHGYEGTGRGFKLKFYKLLCLIRPDWQELVLHQPIRWSINDPLESWIEKLLFLDVKIERKPEVPLKISSCVVNHVEQAELIKNISDKKRNAIFSLLVFAHYRTSPADFQYVLESQNIRIYTLEYQQEILAVLLVNQEGGFEQSLSSAIYRGERRPKGHLLAQTLCFHAGYENAACFNYSRVMRIAVHPEIQNAGYGSYLLQQVIEKEKNYGIDVFGSSFSANSDLLRFWSKAGLSLLRLGFSRDHVSASHSAVVGKALSVEAREMVSALSTKFKCNFSIWLSGPLSDVDNGIKQFVEKNLDVTEKISDEVDWEDIQSFAFYNRNFDACLPAIVRFINNIGELPKALSEQDRAIIYASLQYKNNWAEVVKEIECNGKTQAINMLRSALQRLIAIIIS